MHTTFKKYFYSLQNILDQYEKEVQGLSYEQLNKLPETGGWSIAQILHHISNVEAGAFMYIEKKLQAPLESQKSGLKAAYRSALLTYALRSSKKFKAPKVLQVPEGPYEVKELFSAWKITRQKLEKALDGIADEHIKRMFFNHPIVGKINLRQTLKFHADHMNRHLLQIKGLKKSL